jgi:predicted TIM-barrel fold metal-dependent hydrolase
VTYPIISADSHITEPNEAFDSVDPAYRDRAPRVERIEGKGSFYVLDGFDRTFAAFMNSAAGRTTEQMRQGMEVYWEDMHRGGWDPAYRIADQNRDGVAAEVIYPTMGMVMCGHEDFALKRAVFQGYNRWIAQYCSHNPVRLLGAGQTAMTSPEQGIEDLRAIKALGLRTAMLPCNPQMEDYDSPIYDEFWAAAVELQLPISFHVLTGGKTPFAADRGPRINGFLGIIRSNQDIIGTLIYGGVFERHPRLKVVCVEGDAGWAPHYMYRMDHAYSRHRNWMAPDVNLSRAPSDYFRENVYLTFQDDWTAFKFANEMNWHRLMWANDFPHSDSTWPHSQAMLTEHTSGLSDEQRHAILCGNAADLYGIDVFALARETHKQAA